MVKKSTIVTPKTGAAFNRKDSRQDWGTPPEFIEAVEKRFGCIEIDLAATAENAVCEAYYGPGHRLVPDSLARDWSKISTGVLYLNPPFDSIAKFSAKMCDECRDRRGFSLLLVPASVDANWFRKCEENGFVLILEDRITFVGSKEPYPKGLALIVFGFGLVGRGRWHWDLTKKKAYESKEGK
jgi:phage N-6-adenine-methyltransferase